MSDVNVTVEHWHIIPGGIEFEEADGTFVHVKLTEEQFNSLASHLERVGYRQPDPLPTTEGET